VKEFFWYMHPNCVPMCETQRDRQDIPALFEFLAFAQNDRKAIDQPDWLD